jgi:hypothetical protein
LGEPRELTGPHDFASFGKLQLMSARELFRGRRWPRVLIACLMLDAEGGLPTMGKIGRVGASACPALKGE